MRVGLLTSTLSYREGGGVFEAVRALAPAIHRPPDIEVSIFGLEDENQPTSLAMGGIPVSAFPVSGPKIFGYSGGLGPALRASRADMLHVHGLWTYPSVAALNWHARTQAPYVVSPHGMLDPWALENSRWKKQIATVLYEMAHLRRAACIHALCESEYNSIRDLGIRNPVCVVPNGTETDRPPASRLPAWRAAIPADAKILLFLGRIHPKKGLHNLFRAMAATLGSNPVEAGNWHVVVAGWDQSGHGTELRQLGSALNIDRQIHFVGPQFGEQKNETLCAADAFVLPSLSEGLPFAVLEAMARNLPVLMTRQCNIPEAAAADAAIETLPDVVSLASGLKLLFSSSDERRRTMGANSRRLVEREFTWDVAASRLEAVYHWVLGEGPVPDSVRIE